MTKQTEPKNVTSGTPDKATTKTRTVYTVSDMLNPDGKKLYTLAMMDAITVLSRHADKPVIAHMLKMVRLDVRHALIDGDMAARVNTIRETLSLENAKIRGMQARIETRISNGYYSKPENGNAQKMDTADLQACNERHERLEGEKRDIEKFLAYTYSDALPCVHEAAAVLYEYAAMGLSPADIAMEWTTKNGTEKRRTVNGMACKAVEDYLQSMASVKAKVHTTSMDALLDVGIDAYEESCIKQGMYNTAEVPEEVVKWQEIDIEMVYRNFRNSLSRAQETVLKFRLLAYTTAKIAERMGCTQSRVRAIYGELQGKLLKQYPELLTFGIISRKAFIH